MEICSFWKKSRESILPKGLANFCFLKKKVHFIIDVVKECHFFDNLSSVFIRDRCPEPSKYLEVLILPFLPCCASPLSHLAKKCSCPKILRISSCKPFETKFSTRFFYYPEILILHIRFLKQRMSCVLAHLQIFIELPLF